MKKLIIIAITLLLVLSACATGRQKLSPQGNVDFKTANVYFQQKNAEQAEIYYEKVLADNPDHAVALRRMANIYEVKGSQFAERAVEFYQKAFDYYGKAIAITEAYPNLTDDERVDLRNMKKSKGESWTRIYMVGEAQLKDGNTKAAMATFELANKLDPSRPQPLLQLKNIYLKDLKDDAKAEQILLTMLKTDADNVGLLLDLGAFYYNKQNYAEAIKYMEKAQPQIPRDMNNLMNISACYYELKDYPKAMAATQTALEIEPMNPDLIDNAYNIAVSMKDNDQAIFYLKQLVERRDNKDDYFDLLVLLNQKEKYTEMIEYAEKWYNWDKTSKDAVSYLILSAQKTGNKSMESKYTAILKSMP